MSLIPYRLDTIVRPRLMATGAARAAGFARLVLDQDRLSAEGRRARDEIVAFACVDVVAGGARTPLVLPVDVNVVEVQIAVAELCHFFVSLFLHHLDVVAAETKCVCVLVVRNKGAGRVRLCQQAANRSAVWIVAGQAVPVAYRSVMVRVIPKVLGDVTDLALIGVQLLVVAGQAQPHGLAQQQPLYVGSVGIVAAQAGRPRRDGIVGDGGIVQQLFYYIVAVQTELRRNRTDELRVVRTVRVVARTTRAVADRRVNVLTLVNRHAMASRAKLSIGIDPKEKRVGGTVWVMAQNAHPHLHRLVEERDPVAIRRIRQSDAVMAHVTQLRVVAGSNEFVPRTGLIGSGTLFRFVACLAPVSSHRFMETLVLHHLGVTARCGTRRPGGLGIRGSLLRRLPGITGGEKPRRDKKADNPSYHTSHAQPTDSCETPPKTGEFDSTWTLSIVRFQPKRRPKGMAKETIAFHIR